MARRDTAFHLKPDNVMIGKDGRVRVMDFGLARASEEIASEQDPDLETLRDEITTGGLSEKVTRTGALVGTPAYMAPEQHLHQPAGAKSDQFSFCVSLYEALYGERPFGGDNVHALAFNVTQGKLRETANPRNVPGWVHELLLRGMEVELRRRWPSMRDLLAELRRRRGGRRRSRAGFFLIGAGALSLAVLAWPNASNPCTNATEALSGIWDEARREQVQAGFLATELPFAQTSFDAASKLLDQYAESWVLERQDACEATHVRGEQSDTLLDLRMVCLDRRRQVLSATIEQLADPDAMVVERATRLASDLPAIAPCGNAEALLSGVEPPAPEIASTVEDLRGRMAEAQTRLVAGKYEAGLALARRVEEDAAAVEYPPVRAEASLRRAWLEEASGDRPQAERSALEAYWAARESGHDRVALEAESFLAFVVGHRLDRHDEGAIWARSAEADARRLRPEPQLMATVLTNHGAVLEGKGQYAEAETKHREAIDLLEGSLGERHPRVARARHSLAIALLEQGRARDAIEEERKSIAIREAMLGPEHPLLGRSHQTLGNALRQLGETEQAVEHYLIARDGLQNALGPDHPDVIAALGSLAIGYAMTGKMDESVATFRESCARAERTHGKDSVNYATCIGNLGNALNMTGKSDEALEVFERSLEIRIAKLGPDHPDVGTSHSQVGEILARRDRLDEAVVHLRRGVEIKRAVLGDQHVRLAYPMLMLGEVQLLRDDPQAALQQFEAALAIREKGEVAPLDLAETKFATARALDELKRDPDRVARYIEDAREVFEGQRTESPQYIKDLEDWEKGVL